MLILIGVVIVLVTYISVKYAKLLNYWKDKGVKYIRPLPLVGNTLPTILQSVSLQEWFVNLYNAFPKERYCGVYQFARPILLLRDPELIKNITIKEFDSFSGHAILFDKDVDPFWGGNLFSIDGSRWKNVRQILSPVFTSSKMKSMFSLMENVVTQLIDFLNDEKKDIIEVELNDIVKLVTADCIATAAFGFESNSLKDKNNDFVRMGNELVDLKGFKKFKFLLLDLNPAIAKILKIKIVSDSAANFFHSIITNAMAYRAKEKIHRPDLIHFLMEAKSGRLKSDETAVGTAEEMGSGSNFASTLSDVDITAQALVFFVGGYDTTSTLINFCIYELVANPEIQERLRNEVDEYFASHQGKINYEGLFQMKYLDMVLSETLRKWPPKPFLDRRVTKPFTIPPETKDEKPVSLKTGDICWIPIFGIHRDPHYWPDPEKFDPERFNDANRPKITMSTYIPFGIGPRNCVGSRFALMEAKLLLSHLIFSFEIVPTERTRIPLVLLRDHLLMGPKDGFWFGFKKRNFKKSKQ